MYARRNPRQPVDLQQAWEATVATLVCDSRLIYADPEHQTDHARQLQNIQCIRTHAGAGLPVSRMHRSLLKALQFFCSRW